ncbi:gephyrin-like molybdotransferase Glp [Aridibaculum aurantiacum]|uniref:molybdopterin molybdotransferase MoeA n=1 Tax=Aridibaculum aurantiacum TaxID=2810307 RepID=UPI001A95CD59|nr:gephyrin-like molybdotransferase Glp [Aridibaculum aurantiacum]
MISVQEAKDLIRLHSKQLPAQVLSLKDATGLALAEDIYAPQDFPPFMQSSMDGYAFKFYDWKGEPLAIVGEVQAGSAKEIATSNKQAVRIFTGAPVPAGLDTVVMQEKAVVENRQLHVLDDALVKGSNVRQIGSEIPRRALALEMGTTLTAGAIGFIAGLGISEVIAVAKPSVAIIVTGKELQKPGEQLQYGQVYESNSYALTAALQAIGITGVSVQWVDDDLTSITSVIETAIGTADLVLITGGVSVGDYDFVSQALEHAQVEQVFHKVKQRPGKPLLFAKKDTTIVFGLPGNPSSVLTCFYEYVLLAIQLMMGLSKPFLKTVHLPLAQDYNKNTQLRHFLKGMIVNNEVLPLDAQESYKMRSFAMADCLVCLVEAKTTYKKGDVVEVHILP